MAGLIIEILSCCSLFITLRNGLKNEFMVIFFKKLTNKYKEKLVILQSIVRDLMPTGISAGVGDHPFFPYFLLL